MAYFTNIDGKYVKDVVLRDDIAYIKNAIGYDNILGLQADFESNTFTRLAGAAGKSMGSDFDVFPMYGGRRKCNLADDGTINAWYGEQGYTEDGSNGQVMVYQPKFYYRVVPLKLQEQVHHVGETTTAIANNDTTNPIVINGEDYTAQTDDVAVYNNTTFRWDGSKWTTSGAGNQGYHLLKANYYISATPKAGFRLHPAFYNESGNEVDYILLGAYKGSIYDVSESKYLKWDEREITYDEGGTPTITNAYPADFNNDKISSVAGVKPCSGKYNNLTRANAEKLCKNRGSGWHSEGIKQVSMEQLLMIIEMGGFNTQSIIGQGITNISDSPNTENNSSYTGSTASLGNSTGTAASTVNERAGYEYTYTAANQVSVCYRGRENTWGNVWEFKDGVNVWGNGRMFAGMPYICDNYSYANDKKTDNYKPCGFTLANADAYIKYFGYGNPEYDWLFMPSKTGGNQNIPVGDYFYKTANLNGYRIGVLGGSWYHGVRAGGFYWTVDHASSYRSRAIGVRSIYVPQ